MSRRKVNGVWIDEGPGAGRMTGQLGEGKTSLLHGPGALESDGGGQVGRIERRQVWAAQAEVARFVDDPPVIPPAEEEPVMPEPSSRHARDDLFEALAIHADALAEALEAREVLLAAEQRWEQARQALEATYRDTGLLAVQGGYPVGAPAIADAATELRELVHDGHATVRPLGPSTFVVEPSTNIPKTIPVAAPSGSNRTAKASSDPAGLTPGQRRILDVMVATAGERPVAAARLGLQPQSLDASIAQIRKAGGDRLTSEELAVVAIKRRRPA